MIVALLVLGFFTLPPGIPIMDHNSLAIAAACQADMYDPVNVAELPIKYGVLPTVGGSGRRRVGFSSLEVGPLQDGEVYESLRCVCDIEFFRRWRKLPENRDGQHPEPGASVFARFATEMSVVGLREIV